MSQAAHRFFKGYRKTLSRCVPLRTGQFLWAVRQSSARGSFPSNEASFTFSPCVSSDFPISFARACYLGIRPKSSSLNILNKLREFFSEIGPVHFLPNVALRVQPGDTILLDAIGELPKEIYVVEVKTTAHGSLQESRIEHLRRAIIVINALNTVSTATMTATAALRIARGLLVVPDETNLPDTIDNEIAVLKYDAQLNFRNADIIRNWMNARRE